MSVSGGRRQKKVSLDQLKLLIDFLSQHTELAAGTYRSLEARHHSKGLWAEVTKLLNGHKGGIRRPSNGWSKYWSDFKNKLKNKLIESKRKKLGEIKKEVSPMTKLEKRALQILGPTFEKKYIGDHEEDLPTDPIPLSEIKQESVTLTNGYFKVHSENDRVSDSDDDNSTHQQSDDDIEEEDEDQSSDEPVTNNIYPSWLIEVEKKRAEAELQRAKAEQLRAEVAVKNAEAIFIQSQALQKMSDAAEVQANAILRIATALENRHSRVDILNL